MGSVSSGSMETLRPDDLPAGWASVVSKPPTRRAGAHPQDQHRHWLVFEVMDTGEHRRSEPEPYVESTAAAPPRLIYGCCYTGGFTYAPVTVQQSRLSLKAHCRSGGSEHVLATATGMRLVNEQYSLFR